MSYYTKFADVEVFLTSTTTANTLVSTDALLVTSVAAGQPRQTTPAAISTLQQVTNATTNSSGTTILPYGVTTLTFAAATTVTSFSFGQLQDPPSVGLLKRLIGSTTTSSQNTVNTVSATIKSSSGTNQTGVGFGLAAAALTGIPIIDLVSVSTSVWVVAQRTASCTFSS